MHAFLLPFSPAMQILTRPTALLFQIFAAVILVASLFLASPSPFILVLSLAAALLYLTSGGWLLYLRRSQPITWIFSLFTASATSALALLPAAQIHPSLASVAGLFAVLAGALFIHTASIYPVILPASHGVLLRRAGWTAAMVAASAVFYIAFARQEFSAANIAVWVFAAAALAIFLSVMVFHLQSSSPPLVQEQAKRLLYLALLSYFPLAAALVYSAKPYLIVLAAVFPIGFAQTVIRSHPENDSLRLKQSAVYAVLALLIPAGYALLVTGAGLIIGDLAPQQNLLLQGVLIFFLALLISPARTSLEKSLDQVFKRRRSAYAPALGQTGRQFAGASDLASLTGLLRSTIEDNLKPDLLHIFIYDPHAEHYLAIPGPSRSPTTDLRFPPASPLIQDLSLRRSPLRLGASSALPPALQGEAARLKLLAVDLYLPMHTHDHLAGFLALISSRAGKIFTPVDLAFLEVLCDQAAQAVERIQSAGNLERRIHEMNVLARLSQGINVTLVLDDIFELIYAQTCQVVPTLDFRISLLDPADGALSHAFLLENDERLSQRENFPVLEDLPLEMEVIQTRRLLLVDDYPGACRSRRAAPSHPGLQVWVGVPLNAGADTIGLISLGSRDPAAHYSKDQLDLLQAIAGQAAGAVVKGRLLAETQQRARQLARLNDLSRSLTSTLDLESLKQRIAAHALDLLDGESCLLFLVDNLCQELIVESAAGPTQFRPGERLPLEGCLAGKAAVERSPAGVPGEGPGLRESQPPSRTLAVPLLFQDAVAGVIEVSRRDQQQPFSLPDVELLTAFCAHAAAALENARLYSLTDQALAARLDELSVMQRIDRELNASLDVAQAMRITLAWAVQRSAADAGAAGILAEGGLQVLASTGAHSEFAGEGVLLPLTSPLVEEAVSSAQPASAVFPSPGSSLLLKDARSAAVLPILREGKILGVLILESRRAEVPSSESMLFLSRLVDHASIAVSNAQLYSAVQAANLEKSRFVSFVAHELKNPMASIKGYTELVAKGMAGSVSEMQVSFLSTVLSNVERMNTIVSDLNDLTKIEMGSLRLAFKPTSASESIEEVSRSMQRHIDEKALSLQVSLPTGLPQVWADPTRLTQVLTNLLSNAVKYTPEGGKISLGIELCPDPDRPGAHQLLHFWVADDGIGIPLEDQPHIFRQYYRTGISKEHASGTGLGLHITKTLVEMQGGRIWFESAQGSGAAFHFTIPVVEPA